MLVTANRSCILKCILRNNTELLADSKYKLLKESQLTWSTKAARSESIYSLVVLVNYLSLNKPVTAIYFSQCPGIRQKGFTVRTGAYDKAQTSCSRDQADWLRHRER